MKKKNLFISLIFAFLMCITFNLSIASEKAFAEGSTITITFDADGGSCDTPSVEINPGESIATIPSASRYKNEIFIGWYNESTLIDGSTTFDQDTTLTAQYVRKIFKYSISNNVDKLKIVGQTSNSNFPYTLTDSCDTLENAITSISTDIEASFNDQTISTFDQTVYINFDNITLSQDLELSFNKLDLSGTLNIAEHTVIITPTTNTSFIYLSDIEFISTSTQNFVEILGTNSSTITTSNVKFTATAQDNNYSIKLENPNHTLYFTNKLSYSSQYLYNYEITKGAAVQKQASFESNFVLEGNSKVAITIPFDVDGQSILSSRTGDETLFSVFPNQSNFNCSVKSKTGAALNVSTSFNISFDPNGGTIVDNFDATSTNYRPSTQFNFPSEDNYQKTHFDLSGYLAKFTYSGNTWYFDKTALQAFYNDQREVSIDDKISTNFYSSVPNTSLDGFDYYIYDRTNTDLNFLATNLILELESTPTFVAIWTDTQYTITLDNNDGNEPSTISGIYNSAVTLPNPTRTGYSFIGWFNSLSDANDADPSNAVTITTMPDENITLYAGWLFNSHTLTIYKNNLSNPDTVSVNFGTILSSLDELDSQTIYRKGYSFVGWFTNEELTTPLGDEETMPNNNLSVYAKWTINQYTITLYYNHPSVDEDEIFKTTTQNYNSDVTSLFATNPSFEGYTFNRWCTDKAGRYPAQTIPDTMPDTNVTLYAYFTPNEYTLTIIHLVSGENGAVLFSDEEKLYFNSEISLQTASYTGMNFGGWFANETMTEEFTTTTMPSRNLTVYAKFIEKETFNLNFDAQSYTLSAKGSFKLPDNLEGFTVEYFVDEDWTTTAPTKKGSYNVRISIAESSTHKAFVKTIENGFTITANNADLGLLILIFYCLAAVEILCSIIILFLRKQRKTYLTYAVTLPIGIVSTSQFVNFVISLTLAVFGFILFILQILKLKEVNRQISQISSENSGYVPPDISENKSISRNVEILLEKEGFVSASKEDNKDKPKQKDELSIDDLDEDPIKESEDFEPVQNDGEPDLNDDDDDSLKF